MKRPPRGENVPEGQGDPEPPDSPLFALRTARLVWKALATRARTDAVIEYYKSLYQSDSATWAANREALRGILAERSGRGIPCHVVCFPVLYRLDDTYPFAQIHAEVGRIVREAGGNVIDLLPLLEGRDSAGLQVQDRPRLCPGLPLSFLKAVHPGKLRPDRHGAEDLKQ